MFGCQAFGTGFGVQGLEFRNKVCGSGFRA